MTRTSTVFILSLCSALTICGCSVFNKDFGKGGTGEQLVPKSLLRSIDPLLLQPVTADATAPTTAPTTLPTTIPIAQVRLSLADARVTALRNNLDLVVAKLDPLIASYEITEAEAQFESTFTTSFNFAVLDTPTDSQLQGSSVKTANLTPGIRVPLRTGGFITMSVPIGRNESDNQFQNRPLSFTSDLAINVQQPLLRGAGTDSNAERIRAAYYNTQRSESATKLQVIRVLASVDRGYWRVYAAREELKVRLKELDLAEAQLERANRRVRAQAAAEIEVIRAESGVADNLERIIIAENQLRDRQRELKRILNDPELPLESPTILVTDSPPAAIELRIDQDELLRLAQANRMELLDAELQIAQQTATIGAARNDLLPLVNLDYTFNVNGLGDTLPDAFDMIAEWDFIDNRVGLQVEIPIGNRAARSRLRSALARRTQLLSTKQQRLLQVRQEVLAATDQIDANRRRVAAATRRVSLSQRLLDAEIRQFDLGLRTSTEVLDAQTNLSSAQSSLVNAITEYQIAQVDLAFATGMTVGASRVQWEPAGPVNDRR